MAAATATLRYDEPCAGALVRLDQLSHRRRRDGGMVNERDERGLYIFAQRLDAARDRNSHLAFRLVVRGEAHELKTGERRAHLFGAVADHDDRLSDAGFAKIGDASLDDTSAAERQQRLELSHAPRAPGGEKHGGDVFSFLFQAIVWRNSSSARSTNGRAICLR